YVERMQAEVQLWLDGLGEAGEIEITKEMLRLTQFVVGHAFLGESFRDELDEAFWDEYTHISNSLNPAIPVHWPIPKNIRRDQARKKIMQTLDKVIGKRRDSPDQYDDLITLLLNTPLKDGQPMTDEEIKMLFMGLVFAGHETTAGQAAWLMISLLQHQSYFQEVRRDIKEHFEYDQPITGRVLRNMKHIYWAIDEVTRLYPSAQLQMRLVEEDIDLGLFNIPKGWLVMVNAANSHHLPELWENPKSFDPYRFSPERGEGKNSFSIIGFGGGIHKCTGINFAKNEMAVIATLLFQQFHLELITDDTRILTGMGAARPTPTILRYRRRVPSFDYTDEVKTMLDNLVSLPS
ncbi:MAG: cytochrome P450, partial [Chloroflexota bacterium]